jgi:hypothetical protein
VIAFSSIALDDESIPQYFLINLGLICAFENIFSTRNLSSCICRAPITRSRISADDSAADSLASSLNFTAGTSMCISIRSSSGLDIFDIYL